MKKHLKNDHGMAVVIVMFVVSVFLALTGANLFLSGLNLRMAGNLRTGTTTFQAADAGVQHALAAIPVGVSFPYTSSTTLLSTISLPNLGSYNYSVTVVNTEAGTKAILTSTAQGVDGAKKVIQAYAARGGYGYGSVHAPGNAANIETGFSGNNFQINGNDRCNATSAVPGISTTDLALVTEITNDTLTDGGLDAAQKDNVIGAGPTPSVMAISDGYPTPAQLADAYLALSPTVKGAENQTTHYSGNEYWGTSNSPQITLLKGDSQITGTIEGYGVLIVDGSLDISGNFTFHGLILARGDVQVQLTGNAGIFGSLVLDESTTHDPNLELDVRGSVTIQYDSCALNVADTWAPVPKKAKLVAWQEVL